MNLVVLIKNLILGDMPEAVGLMLFGVSLVAVTIGLRWVLELNENKIKRETGLEKLAGRKDK